MKHNVNTVLNESLVSSPDLKLCVILPHNPQHLRLNHHTLVVHSIVCAANYSRNNEQIAHQNPDKVHDETVSARPMFKSIELDD